MFIVLLLHDIVRRYLKSRKDLTSSFLPQDTPDRGNCDVDVSGNRDPWNFLHSVKSFLLRCSFKKLPVHRSRMHTFGTVFLTCFVHIFANSCMLALLQASLQAL